MRVPIQFALGYPERLKSDFPRFNFLDYPNLTFERPDTKTFRNLELAFEAMRRGGTAPCILNAANEVVVDKFLKEEIGFLEMSDVLEEILDKSAFVQHPELDDYMATDAEVRIKTEEFINYKLNV